MMASEFVVRFNRMCQTGILAHRFYGDDSIVIAKLNGRVVAKLPADGVVGCWILYPNDVLLSDEEVTLMAKLSRTSITDRHYEEI